MGVKNTQFNTRDGWFSEYVSGKYVGYHSEQLGNATPSVPPSGIEATGGVVGQYSDPTGKVWQSHTFTSTGTFDVTALSTDPVIPDNVDYLIVAGGGGGGGWVGGGGGGGGIHYKESHPVTASPYVVTVGAGGYGGSYPGPSPLSDARSGGSSSIAFPSTITAAGGGGGGGFNNSGDPRPGLAGGSGGGGGGCQPGQTIGGPGTGSVSYTHLRAHET